MSDDAEAPAAEVEDDGFREEEWVYLGPMKGGFRWRDDVRGETYAFGKVKGRVFGGIYRIQALRADGDALSALPDAAWTGRRAEDAAQVEVRARAAETALALKRREASASRTQLLDDAVAPLVAIASGLMSSTDRAALIQYVTAKVYGAPSPTTKRKGA